MQSNRLAARDGNEIRTDDPRSSFQMAFSQARSESRSVNLGMISEPVLEQVPATDDPVLRTYEVRIEKRTGKRSSDAERWNKLGKQGWELISVVGKQAFFRRIATRP